MNILNGKTIVIIGGSSGIGFRVAQMARSEGGDLIIAGRNSARLKEAQTALSGTGKEITTIELDAHDHNQLAEFFDKLPKFDHLVSMVGDVMGGGFLNADMTEIRRVIESKFFTNVQIGRLAADKVAENGSLTFTSGTGGRAQDACASYVGNLGINALVEGLAVELAPACRVNAVSPTWTITPLWRDMPEAQLNETRRQFESAIPLKRLASIDDLSATYIYLMKNTFITGQHICVDGGIMLGA
nr:SDR family oxidoreductase [uncultured Desulfobacter sp.]